MELGQRASRHTHRVELAGLQSTGRCATTTRTCIPQPADSCLVVPHTAAVVAAMPTLWNAGVHSTPTCTPIHGRPHVAAYNTAAAAANAAAAGPWPGGRPIFLNVVTFSTKHGSTSDKAYSRLLGPRYVHANAHRQLQSHF